MRGMLWGIAVEIRAQARIAIEALVDFSAQVLMPLGVLAGVRHGILHEWEVSSQRGGLGQLFIVARECVCISASFRRCRACSRPTGSDG